MNAPTRHRGLAAIIIGAAALALAGCSLLGPAPVVEEPETPGTSAPTETNISTADIKVGDCLNDANVGDVVNEVPLVDCSEPHDSEVFFVGELPDGPYPGDDESSAAADALCAQPFIDFVGLPYEESAYDYTWYSPTAQSWESGNRAVRCVAIADSQEKLVGTIAGVEK